MKTTDPRDPLDRHIDALLSSRPIQPSEDFMDRVLSEIEQTTPSVRHRSMKWWIRSGMSLAAALACAFVALQIWSPVRSSQSANALSPLDAQEIFYLEESLSSLPDVTQNGESYELMATFDTIYFGIES